MNNEFLKWFEAEENLKIKDESVLINRDLLQDIRDHLAYDAWDKANTSSEVLLDKLDSIYLFLKQK